MKKIFTILACMMFLGAFSQSAFAQHTLRIELTNFENSNGHVLLALYKGANGFPDDDSKAIKRAKVKVENKKAVIVFEDLPSGDYAFALFHDENDSGEMDKNFMGIPKEGYAFSTNFKPKFSAPDFDEADFQINGNTVQKVRIIN